MHQQSKTTIEKDVSPRSKEFSNTVWEKTNQEIIDTKIEKMY